MTRIAIILLAASILFSGCQTGPRRSDYSPEAWAAWQKCCKIKKGMTYAQVYAIVPSSGRFQAGYSPEMETWILGAKNVTEDSVMMHIDYQDGRVMDIQRSIEHGTPVTVPQVIETR
jgi:hypothetical protein